MRTKSETRRQAIVAAAREVFCRNGFEAASMSEVAAKLGGSKATLYSYFRDKKQLFVETLTSASQAQSDAAFAALDAPGPIGGRLVAFAEHYLRFVLDPDMIAVRRMLLCEGERTGVAKLLYERAHQPSLARIAERLDAAMRDGELRQADAPAAARHFLALVESDLVERRLTGIDAQMSEQTTRATARGGAEVFLAAFSPLPRAAT